MPTPQPSTRLQPMVVSASQCSSQGRRHHAKFPRFIHQYHRRCDTVAPSALPRALRAACTRARRLSRWVSGCLHVQPTCTSGKECSSPCPLRQACYIRRRGPAGCNGCAPSVGTREPVSAASELNACDRCTCEMLIGRGQIAIDDPSAPRAVATCLGPPCVDTSVPFISHAMVPLQT